MELDKFITTEELAKKTGYTTANITHLVREGKIPAVRRGRKYFFKVSVEDLLFKELNTEMLK